MLGGKGKQIDKYYAKNYNDASNVQLYFNIKDGYINMRCSICGTSVIKSEKRCPNCGNRKKYFNSKRIIAIVLLLCMCTPLNTTSHAEYDNDYSQLPSQMMDYILGKEDDALLSRDNYAYVKFVDNYLSNTLATVTTEIIHLLGKTDSLYVIEPEYYATILVNIMALTESTNASSTAEQKKYDNLKTMEDYAVDVTQMMANTVNVYIGVSENLPALFNEISHAISGVSTIIDSTEECMEVYSNLETVLQNYDRFQIFLDSVAENSDGNLKQAALSLRNGMTEAMKVKLASYTNVANINTDLMSEYFFSDTFMELLKEIPEYASDDSFKFFIDSADGFFNKFGVLNTAWEIGAAIGTLAGNLVVGGEDLMSRVREMVALTHIRSALVSAINQAGSDFLSAYAAQTPDNGVAFCNKYIDLAWFLRACDLRGEYCLASIVSSDAKFLTWFNKENIEHAEIWYATRSDGIKIGHSKLHGMIYTDGMTESPETETLSSDNVYSGQNDLSSSEVFNPVGRWTVNTEKTNSANSTALRSFFGSSIEYGFEIILGQDGTASWYIAAGNGGYGSYSFQGASGYLNYTDYEEGYGLTVPLYVLQENGIWYILMEYNGYNLYWTKEADTVIDVPADTDNIQIIFNHYRGEGHSDDFAEIEAIDQNGNHLWRYTTGKYPLAQLPMVHEIGKFKDKYYFMEGTGIIALDAATGDVLWKNNDFYGSALYESSRYIDENGIIYLCGYLKPDLTIINAMGETLCRIETFTDIYNWPYELEMLPGDIMAVRFQDGPYGYRNDGSYVVYVDLNDYSYSFELKSEESNTSYDQNIDYDLSQLKGAPDMQTVLDSFCKAHITGDINYIIQYLHPDYLRDLYEFERQYDVVSMQDFIDLASRRLIWEMEQLQEFIDYQGYENYVVDCRITEIEELSEYRMQMAAEYVYKLCNSKLNAADYLHYETGIIRTEGVFEAIRTGISPTVYKIGNSWYLWDNNYFY